MTVAHQARLWARKFGLEVQRHGLLSSFEARLHGLLQRLAVDLVIDVGAHEGGYAMALREAGWRGAILSFEPLPDAHARLLRQAAGDPAWVVAPAMALADRDGETTMFVAGNGVSSSLLAMLPAHEAAAPESAVVARQAIPLARLDGLALPALQAAGRPFLKADVQGAELAVLRGAEATLQRCVGLQLELSLLPLYAGQPLWREVLDHVQGQGFELWDLAPGFRSPQDGRLLQLDAVLVRQGLA